jgi:AbrB family looped-hinge helix DNA binding protein
MVSAIVNGMILTIDKAGRVILPKPLRDRLGLRGGSALEMEETAEGVLLKPAGHKPSLVRQGRFLVHTGQLPRGCDLTAAINDDRGERARKIWGRWTGISTLLY